MQESAPLFLPYHHAPSLLVTILTHPSRLFRRILDSWQCLFHANTGAQTTSHQYIKPEISNLSDDPTIIAGECGQYYFCDRLECYDSLLVTFLPVNSISFKRFDVVIAKRLNNPQHLRICVNAILPSFIRWYSQVSECPTLSLIRGQSNPTLIYVDNVTTRSGSCLMSMIRYRE